MTKQFFILLILLLAVLTTTQAQTPAAPPGDHSHMSKDTAETTAAEKYFTDVELTNQDGCRERR